MHISKMHGAYSVLPLPCLFALVMLHMTAVSLFINGSYFIYIYNEDVAQSNLYVVML